VGAKISKIDFYLPENILTNEELSKIFPDWTPEKIEDKVGVRQRHIVKSDETASDLALIAARKVLENEDEKTIDFLLLCTQSPDYYLPSTSCVLQNQLGLPNSIGAFDFNLGCSGYVYGLGIAKGLICAGLARKVLFITSETYSKHINAKDKGNRTIFGDGATASIIEYSDKNHIFEFELGTDGSGFDKLIVPNGGLRSKLDYNAPILSEEEPITKNDLYMNGPEVFNFTIQRVPKLVEAVLAKNNLSIDDIDFFIFHQANKFILDYLRKKIRIPTSKFYNKLLFTGNTVSSTIPLALHDALTENKVKKGDKVLLVGFGVGLSWGATVLEI
jgi:3-oxoacyl-[acyl-carrier-protein] synthase III